LILVDANILVYASVGHFEQHDAARAWLDERLNGVPGVGLPWASLLAFVRLVSNRRIFERPMSAKDAWHRVEAWLECPAAWVPGPIEYHREILATLLPAIGSRPNLVPDAHLAAIAIEHGITLCSTDADFSRFPGLRWENPLAP